MKRIISIIMISVLFFSINTFNVFGNNQTELNVKSEITGSYVTYTVFVQDNEPIVGMDFKIYYDKSQIKAKSIERGDILTGGFFISNLQENVSLYNEDYITAIWMSVNATNEKGSAFKIICELANGVKEAPQIEITGTIKGKGSKNIDYIITGDGVKILSNEISDRPQSTTPAFSKCIFSKQKIVFDDIEKQMEVYNIDGSNYFKLRDVAFLMKNTDYRFSVDYDASKKDMITYKGRTYIPVGGELSKGIDKSKTCCVSKWMLKVNDVYRFVNVYNIGGNNFFKLRDLGLIFGFNVDYDSNTKTVVIQGS